MAGNYVVSERDKFNAITQAILAKGRNSIETLPSPRTVWMLRVYYGVFELIAAVLRRSYKLLSGALSNQCWPFENCMSWVLLLFVKYFDIISIYSCSVFPLGFYTLAKIAPVLVIVL